jgi:hypothetical protein
LTAAVSVEMLLGGAQTADPSFRGCRAVFCSGLGEVVAGWRVR